MPSVSERTIATGATDEKSNATQPHGPTAEQQHAPATYVPSVDVNRRKSRVGKDLEARKKLYKHSIEETDVFWSRIAKEDFYWHKLWADDKAVRQYNFHRSKGEVYTKWFDGGETNVCYNALDRHLPQHKKRVCFHWEGNDPGSTRTVTYGDMYDEVVAVANILKTQYGIRKGDRVSVYLPMIPFAASVMLACARIGAVVSVVFGGFSAQALSARLVDAQSPLLITADASFRGDKPVPLKNVSDTAIEEAALSGLQVRCLVFENADRKHCTMAEGRDTWYKDALKALTPEQRRSCPIEWMAAEDPLFMLYTSGSTGKPKALLHTTGGYMVYAATTFKYTFDYHPDDVYFCTADVGWVTGHSYVVYGPMIHCATSVLFEGVPTYPNASRWWELVEKYKVSIFYTAPTAIRSLMQAGDAAVKRCDRSTLRILGSVGEPINVEAWNWFHNVVGEGRADIMDTWWQTETGGHMITPLPGCTPMKPASATLPFFGVEPVILDPRTFAELEGPAAGLLAIRKPWPGQARTIAGDHARYEEVYFSTDGYYMSGDGARRDEDGYIWITGRVDDVMNVSGHRIGTSEVESAVNSHPAVVESAVVGVPHDIKGESIYVYLTFHKGTVITPQLFAEVKATVRQVIGPLATPDYLHPAQEGLPKTRSGKIVRRILRKIATRHDDDLGDVTTLADPAVVVALISARREHIDI